jgi:hypothetical protein
MLGSTVYLEGGRTATVGTESEGITVLEVVNPWKLRIRHKGKEYEVPVGQPPNQSIFRPLGSATLPSGLSVRRAEDIPPDAPAATPTEAGAPTSSAAPPAAPPAPPPEGAVPDASARPANADEAPPIPMPVNRAQVSRMDAAAARAALAAVTAAKERTDLDPTLRQRLESEEAWLVDRLSQLER